MTFNTLNLTVFDKGLRQTNTAGPSIHFNPTCNRNQICVDKCTFPAAKILRNYHLGDPAPKCLNILLTNGNDGT
jgi:hypothetical protein